MVKLYHTKGGVYGLRLLLWQDLPHYRLEHPLRPTDFKKQNPSTSRIKKVLDISIIIYYNALRKEVKDMRTLSFRISEKNFERLTDLQNKWNKADARTPEIKPYTKTDIINMCICLMWETEFTLGINSERKNVAKENFSE